jgi:hypothetical protein
MTRPHEERVLDELERLQNEVWVGAARISALRAALCEALPLLAHAVHSPPGACRRCRALSRIQSTLGYTGASTTTE